MFVFGFVGRCSIDVGLDCIRGFVVWNLVSLLPGLGLDPVQLGSCFVELDAANVLLVVVAVVPFLVRRQVVLEPLSLKSTSFK